MLFLSEVAQSCPTPCNLMDCSLPGSSIHGIFPGKNTDFNSAEYSPQLTIWSSWEKNHWENYFIYISVTNRLISGQCMYKIEFFNKIQNKAVESTYDVIRRTLGLGWHRAESLSSCLLDMNFREISLWVSTFPFIKWRFQ